MPRVPPENVRPSGSSAPPENVQPVVEIPEEEEAPDGPIGMETVTHSAVSPPTLSLLVGHSFVSRSGAAGDVILPNGGAAPIRKTISTWNAVGSSPGVLTIRGTTNNKLQGFRSSGVDTTINHIEISGAAGGWIEVEWSPSLGGGRWIVLRGGANGSTGAVAYLS